MKVTKKAKETFHIHQVTRLYTAFLGFVVMVVMTVILVILVMLIITQKIYSLPNKKVICVIGYA